MLFRSGDANLDGKINIDDYGHIDSSIGIGLKGWFNGDFNYDGTVDTVDFNLFASNFGQVMPAEADTPMGAIVPEPGCAFMLLGSMLLGTRRLRRRPCLR